MRIVLLCLLVFSTSCFAGRPAKLFELDKSWFVETTPSTTEESLAAQFSPPPPAWCADDSDDLQITPVATNTMDTADDQHYSEIPKKIITTQLQDGPPKWIPPELAYWDSSAGDWRFSKTNWEDENKDEYSPPDMIMLGIKYDNANKSFSFGANLNPKYWYGVFRPQQAQP